jgi:tetratricopeptide (TPR) repeat protein
MLRCRQFHAVLFFVNIFAIVVLSADQMPEARTDARPHARFAAAKQATGATAQRLYQELAADTTLSDSLRAFAAACRADLAFALREYETAVDYYSKAAAFEKPSGHYHYRLGLAALANNDTAGAARAVTPVAEGGQTEEAHCAQVLLGDCALHRGAFNEAMALFQKTGPFSLNDSWSIEALLGKLTCARLLGLADSAAAFEKQLSACRQPLLEKERLRKIRAIPLAKPPVSPACTVAAVLPGAPVRDTIVRETAKDTLFALQVGAFGSKERAQVFTKKLSAKYRNVECVTATIDERTIYRVWVGKFESREEAEGFGKMNFIKQGIVYRVVMK